MKRLVGIVLAVALWGCDGQVNGPLAQPPGQVQPAPPAPVLDEAALIARGLAYRTGGFRRVSMKYASQATAGARIVVWSSVDAVTDYARINPSAQGSHAMVPVGAMVVREVYDAQDTLKKLTFVAQGPEGYNPAAGDLWFAATDPSGRLLDIDGMSQHGALASCSGCHAGRAMDGFLFGVPPDELALNEKDEPADAGVEPPPVDAGVMTPPDDGPRFDLAGTMLVNAEAALASPQVGRLDGVTLSPGQVLVVARDATRAEFEAFWSVTLADDVAFLDARAVGGHDAPIINGGEVWELHAPGGQVLDGPTIPGAAGLAYQRDGEAWRAGPASPGVVDGTVPSGLRVTEWSDASDYRMEFVELRWTP